MPDVMLRSPQSVAGVGRALREAEQPSVTVTGNFSRARWVLRGNNGNPRDGYPGRPGTQPSMTVTGQGRSWNWTGPDPVPPRQVRLSEASALQSFPGPYPWAGSKLRGFVQVGNAVPPLLACAVLGEVSG